MSKWGFPTWSKWGSICRFQPKLDYRVEFGGRTGGAHMHVDLDTIRVATGSLPQLGYTEWALTFALTGPEADPGADPDGDLIVNLLEYILKTIPTDPSSGPPSLPTGSFFANRLFYVFNLANPLGGDVRVDVEASDDGATWTSIANKTGEGEWMGMAVVGEDLAIPGKTEYTVRTSKSPTGRPA